MANEENKIRLAELEQKWLDGTITDAEAKEYAAWYNQHQDEPFFVPEGIAVSREEHRLKMLQTIQQKIDLPTRKTPRSRLKKPIYKIAAAAVVVAILFGSYYFFFPSKQSKDVLVQQDFKPGNKGLTLLLDDGRTVAVNREQDGVIAQQGDVTITKIRNTISYNGRGSESIKNVATTQYGEQYYIQLPDSSQVWLNAGSSLEFSLGFGQKRVVTLSGEAYFEIYKDEKKPFFVLSKGQTISVLGTHFNVRAYDDDEESVTTLLEGKIKIASSGNMSKTLLPGEESIISHNAPTITLRSVAAPESQISWKNGAFYFFDSNIKDIMKQISRWYNAKVQYAPAVDMTTTFSGNTPMDQNLSDVLKVLNAGGIHCRIADSTIYVLP